MPDSSPEVTSRLGHQNQHLVSTHTAGCREIAPRYSHDTEERFLYSQQ